MSDKVGRGMVAGLGFEIIPKLIGGVKHDPILHFQVRAFHSPAMDRNSQAQTLNNLPLTYLTPPGFSVEKHEIRRTITRLQPVEQVRFTAVHSQ
jgi:hypothetical protein